MGAIVAAERRVAKIGKLTVDAAHGEASAYRLWDADLKGFGLKVSPHNVKTYFVWYRAGRGRNAVLREFTIGRHGALTAKEARDRAERVLGGVRNGDDPQALLHRAREELNVSDLCDLYLREGVATKKPLTLKNDRYRIERHIKPLLGRKPVSGVAKADVERFMRDVAGGKSAVNARPTIPEAMTAGWRVKRRQKGDPPGSFAEKPDGQFVELRGLGEGMARGGSGAATRAIGLLGAVFNFAVDRGMRPDNPVTRVKRFKDRAFQRFLSAQELARLGAALEAGRAGGASPMGIAVIRLLALSGARRNEIESLTWAEVDFARSCLVLIDSKTGAKVVPLGAAAMVVLAGLPRSSSSPFVFPSAGNPRKAYSGAPKVWDKVRAAAGLQDVRLHDLRHTFASLAAAGGQSLPLIGAILGHKDAATTKRYAHLADDPVRLAADRTASAAQSAMAGRSAEPSCRPGEGPTDG